MTNIIVFAFHENRNRVALARPITGGRKGDLEGFKGTSEDEEYIIDDAIRVLREEGGIDLPEDRFTYSMALNTHFEETEAFTVFLDDQEFHQVATMGGSQETQVATHYLRDIVSVLSNVQDKNPGFPREYIWALFFMAFNQGNHEPLQARKAFDLDGLMA